MGAQRPGEENEQAIAGRRSSRACEPVFGQTGRIKTAMGEPLLDEGSDDGRFGAVVLHLMARLRIQ